MGAFRLPKLFQNKIRKKNHADDSYMGTLGAFTRNLLRSWMQAFGARTSFAGLYQGRETSVVQDHRRSPAHAQRLCVPERDKAEIEVLAIAESLEDGCRGFFFRPGVVEAADQCGN